MKGVTMPGINLRQVEAFRAVMVSGSVTAAAGMMGITQPAASRLLRDLQTLLRMQLFEKRGTGLVPTAAASALYTEVERSFSGLDRIAAAAEEIRTRRTGMLRVAALPALSNGFMPRFAGHFLAERPNLNFALFGVISPLVIDWVLNLQCDIGFAEVPIAHAGLPIIRMPVLPRVAILPEGHRLCAKSVLRPRDFEDETFISLTPGSASRHLIDSVFSKHGVSRVLRVETTLSEIMCGMVSSGLGVSICDPFTAAEFAPRGLVSRPFLPRIDFEFAAVLPPQRRPSPVAEEFVEAFAEHVRAMAASNPSAPQAAAQKWPKPSL
jgi:DNA-binding transcriptional LysR family regulator